MRDGARFIVGIDLGTTHTAVASIDLTKGEAPATESLLLRQLVQPGEIAARALLPSFLYLASPSEFPAGSLDLPWRKDADFAVGELARSHGWKVPMRLVSSAKSWLSHAGVDRAAKILPPQPPGAEAVEVARISPVEAQARYLEHVRAAWNHEVAAADPALALEHQELYLTVPASFDAVARELTVRAATMAGLEVTLLEEPQAAFHAFIGQRPGAGDDGWRKQLRVGDTVLVCDIGGGTTDFSLIAVRDDGGNLALERIAVGEHILLGGDNMDLALATQLAQRLAAAGTKLDPWQLRSLVHACRAAKEALLGSDGPDAHPVTVLGRGRSVIGGTLRSELTRAEALALVRDGFFPLCAATDAPQQRRRAGLQELGLPFAADAAVTRHLARFLAAHAARPTVLLFNGGVMKSPTIRERVVATIESWVGVGSLRVLEGADLDLAVAHGAAFYGLAQRGRGVRIRGGAARSYYIGIESSLPAVPGMAPPIRGLCVAPRGMEEGTEAAVTAAEFGLLVGEPAEFRLLSSTVRRQDAVGMVLDEVDELDETAPLVATLAASAAAPAGQLVPVTLRARLTEVGTLEVWCVSRSGERWKLEHNLRGDVVG